MLQVGEPELVLEVLERTLLPPALEGDRAVDVGELVGGRVEDLGHVGHARVGGEHGPAEAVEGGEPADQGDVGVDGVLGGLLVAGAGVPVVGTVDHDLAAVDPTLELTYVGVGLGAHQRPLEQAADGQRGDVADADGGGGDAGVVAEGARGMARAELARWCPSPPAAVVVVEPNWWNCRPLRWCATSTTNPTAAMRVFHDAEPKAPP